MLEQFSSSHIQKRVLVPLLRSCDHSVAESLYARDRPGHHHLNPWLHLQRGLQNKMFLSESTPRGRHWKLWSKQRVLFWRTINWIDIYWYENFLITHKTIISLIYIALSDASEDAVAILSKLFYVKTRTGIIEIKNSIITECVEILDGHTTNKIYPLEIYDCEMQISFLEN